MLKPPTPQKPNDGFIDIQARERCSDSEYEHDRSRHFWLAQDVLEVKSIDKSCSKQQILFSPGDQCASIATLTVFKVIQLGSHLWNGLR